jgi:hypothetical protein
VFNSKTDTTILNEYIFNKVWKRFYIYIFNKKHKKNISDIVGLVKTIDFKYFNEDLTQLNIFMN